MQEATKILERIAGLADELKLANLRPQITACRNLLQTHNGIDVAVFGRFKAGKSSFLNHLTGQSVLPIGVVPLTAVITRLCYGAAERVAVHFLDGTTRDIPRNEIALFVSESENPDNIKKVAAVEVTLPALQPLAPLQFVDTPGLDSALAHNTEVARQWLPNVGAALVAVSADAPLSEHDMALLQELRRHTPKIALLLTKADLLTEPQRAEVLAYVQQQLRRAGLEALPVFFYSIQPALSGLKLELEQNLLTPLRQQGGKAAAQIAHHKLLSLLDQTRDYLRIALAAATQTESARQTLREQLAGEHRALDDFREELQVLSNEWFGQALDSSLDHLRYTQRHLQTKVTEELSFQFPYWRMRLHSFVQTYGQWLHRFLTRELGQVSHAQKTMFCSPLYKARLHLERTLQAFQDRLAARVRTAFGLALPPCEFKLEAREPAAPPVAVGAVFAIPWDLLGNVLPLMTLARPLIERHLLQCARYEVEKNLSRLAAGWRDRVNLEIQHLRQQAETYSANEVASLEQMLNQTHSALPPLQQALAELGAVRTGLAEEMARNHDGTSL
jgi:GTP-binding protein EngB required for normal cell division